MVKPASFAFNEHAAQTNHFQTQVKDLDAQSISQKAIEEFEGLANAIRDFGVTVNIVNDSVEPKKPDAIFPNNWATYHADGTVVLYPMCSPNRRWERRRSILDMLGQGYTINNEIDLSHYEEDGLFLEGTGSMVLDRPNKICYACLSERTDTQVIKEFCDKLGYEMILFHSVDAAGNAIYHTNVMMAMATDYVVICMASIGSEAERQILLQKFKDTGKELIDISFGQVTNFAGNVIELENGQGNRCLVMSSRAYSSFTAQQKFIIEQSSNIVHAPIETIEKIGGGGARCMVAEVFLPTKE